MRKISNKIISGLLVLSIAAFGLTGVTANAASDNNVGFSFHVNENQHASFGAEPRYRSTSKTNNCWKVNMTYSGEGVGTCTYFWLGSGTTVVSNRVLVKQGSGARYRFAYETASQTNVRLRAQNNNQSITGYDVGGYWDEETGVFKQN